MGIKQSSGGPGALFFSISGSEGCFKQGRGESAVTYEPGTGIEGIIEGLRVEEHTFPDGAKKEELRIMMRDIVPDQPKIHITFSITNNGDPSYFGLRTLGVLAAADFSKPVEIKPYLFKAGDKRLDGGVWDKDTAGVAVKQDGQSLKPDFGTPDNKIPDAPEMLNGAGQPVMSAGRKVRDHSAPLAHLDAQLERLMARFAPAQGQQQAAGIDPAEMAAGAAAASAPSARDGMRARA